MNTRFSVVTFIVLVLSMHVPTAKALTMQQFSDICDSSPKECVDYPVLQAYVGGALDLLATLDERTDYLDKIYCKEPEALFDVAKIIRFMELRKEQYAKENAMLVFIRYFEEQGACSDD